MYERVVKKTESNKKLKIFVQNNMEMLNQPCPYQFMDVSIVFEMQIYKHMHNMSINCKLHTVSTLIEMRIARKCFLSYHLIILQI